MARDSPVGSPVVSRRNDLNTLSNTYHIDPGLHEQAIEQAFQQQILQVSGWWAPVATVRANAENVLSTGEAKKTREVGVSTHTLLCLLALHISKGGFLTPRIHVLADQGVEVTDWKERSPPVLTLTKNDETQKN